MRSGRLLAVMLLSTLVADAHAQAAESRQQVAMLDEAERIRSTDKEKAQRLLDEVSRTLSATSDPLVRAQAYMLECRFSDDPAVISRAAAAGLAIAERSNSLLLRAKLVACRAAGLQREGRTLEAERQFAIAVRLGEESRNAAVEAEARSRLAWPQYNRGAMADALANLQISYRISSQLVDDEARFEALGQMANVYADAKVAQYDRAIEYYRQLAAEFEKRKQPSSVADMLYNIGSTFETKGNPREAELHYRRALQMFERVGTPLDIAYAHHALGSSLNKQGRAREALPHFDASLAHFEGKRDPEGAAWVKQYRGSAYRRLGRNDEALSDLASARSYYEKEKNVRYLEKNVDETSLVYEQLGDWQNAYAFRKRHDALEQELATARRDELASRLRVEFDTEKKEQENRALARENALRASALRAVAGESSQRAVALREAQQNQRLQLAVMALTALLAIALAVLFWRQVVNTRRLRAMAMTDELTRLPNRRHILSVVEMAVAEARRNRRPVALIELDIDRFKRINDTLGHAAGDEILKRVARTCRLALRAPDQIGRIGGEEFLIVLHDATSAQQACEVAERLRKAVDQLDVSSIAPDLHITISLGVCVTSEHDANAAIAGADTLLYRAKENGRNRVELGEVDVIAS